MTKRRRNAIVAVTVLAGIGLLALFQIEVAKNTGIGLSEMQIMEKGADKTTYGLTLKFENPGVLPFVVGETRYSITVNGEKVGEGMIDPFILEPLGSKTVNSRFVAETHIIEKYRDTFEEEDSRIDGTSTYNLSLLSFEVPFDHEPTPDQMRQFFNQ